MVDEPQTMQEWQAAVDTADAVLLSGDCADAAACRDLLARGEAIGVTPSRTHQEIAIRFVVRPPPVRRARPKTEHELSPHGACFKQARQAAQLSLMTAAKRLGVSVAQLSLIECGWTVPDAALLRRMAEAYGAPGLVEKHNGA